MLAIRDMFHVVYEMKKRQIEDAKKNSQDSVSRKKLSHMAVHINFSAIFFQEANGEKKVMSRLYNFCNGSSMLFTSFTRLIKMPMTQQRDQLWIICWT